MPTYGRFEMQIADPERIWSADYSVPKGNLVQFWNRSSVSGEPDIFIGIVRLAEGQTICEISSTSRAEPAQPSVYQAVFGDSKPAEIHKY